ncbi:MAG: UDP-N-acetylmuramate dehydrogenase [Actinomycetota bacterium]
MTRDLAGFADALESSLAGTVRREWPLAKLTTYRLGGPAAIYAEPADVADLRGLGRALRDAAPPGLPVLTVGRGSNLVVSDRGWPGLVIRLAPTRWSWIEPLEDFPALAEHEGPGLVAGAATPLPLLANWAARRGLAGLEFLIAIPGSVGGAVRMNAGAHGSELSDRLAVVRVFRAATLETGFQTSADLALAYRGSNLGDHDIVLYAAFALTEDEAERVRGRMEEYRRHRAETQPGAVQNAGSVFKNPPGDHAGRLVDEAGLKGLHVGGAAVSTLHANFFIAGQGARAQNVFDLVHEVRARVRERFGVELTPEITFAGAFESRSGAPQGDRS